MKQDIKNISYSFQKDREDKDLIYKIDVLLYQEIDTYFIKELADYEKDEKYVYKILNKSVDKVYLNVLEDREGIIDLVVSKLKDNAVNEYKLFYLVDMEFMKQLNKCKRYYAEKEKTKNNLLKQKQNRKEERLKSKLENHFTYCFDIMKQKRPVDTILILMGSSDFRKGTIEDLKLNVKDYKEFDKVFDRVLSDFRKHHKYDYEEPQEEEKLSFGWKLYGITKIIEGLFKM